MVTEHLLKAVAQSEQPTGPELLLDLLRHGMGHEITPQVIIAAAGNKMYHNELLSVLLKGPQRFRISEVLRRIIKSECCDAAMLSALLKQAETQAISSDVFTGAASNRVYSIELMSVLVEKGNDLRITEDTVLKAVENRNRAVESVKFLLDLAPNLLLTRDFLHRAIIGFRYGTCSKFQFDGQAIEARAFMSMLLARITDFSATAETLELAAKKGARGYGLLQYLLDCFPHLSITEEALKHLLLGRSR